MYGIRYDTDGLIVLIRPLDEGEEDNEEYEAIT